MLGERKYLQKVGMKRYTQKILIGGHTLDRGYTVEGLIVSYLTRKE